MDDRLPVRIIATDELEGPEYAGYRALSDRPRIEDVKTIIDRAEEDEQVQRYAHALLSLLSTKNPELIAKIKEDKRMSDKWMEIFKDEIDEKVRAGFNEGRNEGINRGQIQAYCNMVRQGLIT